MFSETREEEIFDILKSISYMERNKAVIAGTCKTISILGPSYNEVDPDKEFSKIMTKAVKEYKNRLHEELKKIHSQEKE